MDKLITIRKKQSLYIKSMKWHVKIKTEYGKSSNYFKTKKEAEYFAERMKDCTYNKTYKRNES